MYQFLIYWKPGVKVFRDQKGRKIGQMDSVQTICVGSWNLSLEDWVIKMTPFNIALLWQLARKHQTWASCYGAKNLGPQLMPILYSGSYFHAERVEKHLLMQNLAEKISFSYLKS